MIGDTMQEKISIGNVEVLSVVDMFPPGRATSFFFPDVPENAWDPYREEQLSPAGEIVLPYCLFVLRSQGQIILADTGMGAGPHPSRGNLTGNLLNELQNIGISPDDVDIVVHTHLHADHVGWNITYEDGVARPTFPKAKYLVPRADWEHFIQANILSLPQNEHIRDHVAPLEELGVMELVEGGQIITSEISTLHTPGHTPGHQCILIDSEGQRGVVVGDVIHMSVQIEHSDWCAGVDLDKPTGQKSREDLLDHSGREGLLIVAGHFKVNEHFGRVARLEGRRYWQVI